MIVVKMDDFKFLKGLELIENHKLPVSDKPPAYQSTFCKECGSPVPNIDPNLDWLEIPAGLLDADPLLRPDKHIFVENKAPWYEVTDSLPQCTKEQLYELRKKTPTDD